MNPPAIVSLGEVLWDLFPDGERFGGAPANFACHAAALGGSVSMVSAVGDDPRGRAALEILRTYDVDVSRVQVKSDVDTGTVGVELNRDGKPDFTIHEGSAWDSIRWDDEMENVIARADAVYFGTLSQRSESSRQTIRRCVKTAGRAGVPRILDINLRIPFFDAALIRDSVRLASILKLNDDELPQVCDAFGIKNVDSAVDSLQQLLLGEKLDCIVMTRGKDGAMLVRQNEVVRQDGIHTEVVDTVGAGDAFTAAFLIGLLQHQSDDQNLRNACSVASGVCSHSGAVPPRPAVRELERFRSEKPSPHES